MAMPSRPASETISPALASSISTLFKPWKVYRYANGLGQVLAVRRQPRQLLPGLDLAGKDAPDRGHAAIIVITECGHQHLQGRIRVHVRRGMCRRITSNRAADPVPDPA